MTDRDEPEVGTLGEEAAKLLLALQEWTLGGSVDAASSPTGGLLSDLNEHIATGSADCRYCPLCQLIAAVRATSPEVKNHLSVAASSMLQAAAVVLMPKSHGHRNDSGSVERIDLDVDGWEED